MSKHKRLPSHAKLHKMFLGISGPLQGPGRAGTVTETSVSVIARGPTGLTTVFTGATTISVGAILSPCMYQQCLSILPTFLCKPWRCRTAAASHCIALLKLMASAMHRQLFRLLLSCRC